MKVKEKLIKFMDLKAERIKECAGVRKERYFDETDMKNIREWNEKECNEIWEELKKNSEKYEGLHIFLCPFCIKHKDECYSCEYGDNHGVCIFPESDFNSICYAFGSYSNIKKCFNKAFYKDIVEKVEEGK